MNVQPKSAGALAKQDDLDRVVDKRVSSVPQALAALGRMEVQLASATTYEELRVIQAAAEVFARLYSRVEQIKQKAEDVVLIASERIGKAILDVQKGRGPGGAKGTRAATANPPTGKCTFTRGDLPMNRHERSRLTRLAKIPDDDIAGIKAKLRAEKRDVTPHTVVDEYRKGGKAARRAKREEILATKLAALPHVKYGIVVADPEWRFATRSERGMDRSADNHYPTSTLEEIKARPVQDIAADDCILFLWSTVPMLEAALATMKAWGFKYVSHYVWVKHKKAHGYWSQNQHELLLVGTQGNVVPTKDGAQWGSSVIEARAGRHSAKPEVVLERIEAIWPNVPKIELNRRGPPRPGWHAWGADVDDEGEM